MVAETLGPTTCIGTLSQPLTLPCGLVLPNRLVKCPMQETLAEMPTWDPPVDKFKELYGQWARSKYGLIITGQVQVDIRFLSVPGDVVVRKESLEPAVLAGWREWASIAQANGTPCIVQLAHPGRMSPKGAGLRPHDMPTICPSVVPVELGDRWVDKKAIEMLIGDPREASLQDIDDAVEAFVVGARVAEAAGFKGVQIHAAHGFLVSQFLSPHTNRRTDAYGGSPENRLRFLKRIVEETRKACSPAFCLSVKLNSGDYMKEGGLTQDEALDQVRWLVSCGMVDMVEISGGSASSENVRLLGDFTKKSLSKAPVKKDSTRIRESFFADFAERVQGLKSKVPIQLSGGYRSRVGMADAIESGSTDLIGLGRAAVIEPNLPAAIILNDKVPDSEAIALPLEIKGLWLARLMPVRAVGQGLPIQFFYYNMKLLGAGLPSDPTVSLPFIAMHGAVAAFQEKVWQLWSSLWTHSRATRDMPEKNGLSLAQTDQLVSGTAQAA